MEKVKYAALALCLAPAVQAQSPYLSVSATMEVPEGSLKQFRMEMKICSPVAMSVEGDWFTQDTSAIPFSQLTREDVHCGAFEGEGAGSEVLTGGTPAPMYNRYSFGNQVFAWEKILVFRITDVSIPGQEGPPRMYVFLPVRYKAFVTSINIPQIPFLAGQVLDLSAALATYGNGRVSIHTQPGKGLRVPLHDFYPKDWVE